MFESCLSALGAHQRLLNTNPLQGAEWIGELRPWPVTVWYPTSVLFCEQPSYSAAIVMLARSAAGSTFTQAAFRSE
jgi:hypothetical protein